MELIDFNLFEWLKTAHPLVFLGLLLLLSHVGGKVANNLKAPRVTGYLVVGLLLSPSALGLFHERLVKEDLTLITDIALSIIAFSIGGAGMDKVKKTRQAHSLDLFGRSFRRFPCGYGDSLLGIFTAPRIQAPRACLLDHLPADGPHDRGALLSHGTGSYAGHHP
ncbi:MAG: hypothetical protein KAT62_08330 [Desulfuromonadales bacterium]|nr:hypothetical protein [Desulfuromonadales bacterium]